MLFSIAVDLYLQGESLARIGRAFGVHHTTISRLLKRLRVPIRSKEEQQALDAKRRENGEFAAPGRPRTYTRNERFFEQRNPVSAYVLGFIQADGTLRPDRFSITCSVKTDTPFLKELASRMGSNRPLLYVEHPFGQAARLVINSRKMADDIRAWGIDSPRTYDASTHPELLDDRDYWRGVVDGDGTLAKERKQESSTSWFHSGALAGPQTLCQEFLEFARRHRCGSGTRVRPKKGSRGYTVRINGRVSASRLARILYDGAELALPRKAEIYRRYYAET